MNAIGRQCFVRFVVDGQSHPALTTSPEYQIEANLGKVIDVMLVGTYSRQFATGKVFETDPRMTVRADAVEYPT